jgi:hypothetical protein
MKFLLCCPPKKYVYSKKNGRVMYLDLPVTPQVCKIRRAGLLVCRVALVCGPGIVLG